MFHLGIKIRIWSVSVYCTCDEWVEHVQLSAKIKLLLCYNLLGGKQN